MDGRMCFDSPVSHCESHITVKSQTVTVSFVSLQASERSVTVPETPYSISTGACLKIVFLNVVNRSDRAENHFQ
jgi:hypothetical protein